MSESKATSTKAARAAHTSELAAMRRAPTHPGEVFRIEFREAADPPMSQAEASRRLGWTNNSINTLELGKRSLTVENALDLEALTGASAEFWMTLQTRYDLWHAMHAPGRKKKAIEPLTAAAK